MTMPGEPASTAPIPPHGASYLIATAARAVGPELQAVAVPDQAPSAGAPRRPGAQAPGRPCGTALCWLPRVHISRIGAPSRLAVAGSQGDSGAKRIAVASGLAVGLLRSLAVAGLVMASVTLARKER